ncbi:MAG: hypothetical protein HQK55_13760 [Deltaproteobacteria bacterium]|nr:hypothetical protein [Deltaproteobacteria bacterium]
MKQYEYQITRHPAEEFAQLAYFCSADGACNLEEVPKNQIDILEEILNARGRAGWQLVQLSFGKSGLLAFWRRRKKVD